MNLHELAVTVAGLDEKAFFARYPSPALVFLTETTRLEDTPEHDTVDEMTVEEFARGGRKTMRMTDAIPTVDAQGATAPASGGPPREERAVTPSSTVFFLVKTDRNPYGSMITVGRAGNNDVVLPIRTISKMHAYFMQQGGKWRLTDQHSANGTFVDAYRVPTGQSAPLHDGARIDFGVDSQCRFYLPAGLFKMIEAYRPHIVRDEPPR